MIKKLAFALSLTLGALAQERPPVPQFMIRIEAVRPEFPKNMTDEERRLGMEHMRYLKRLENEGKLIYAGQVWDPKHFWGISVLNVPDPQAAAAILEADPAIQGKLLKGEVFPFRTVIGKGPTSGTPVLRNIPGGKAQLDIEYGKAGGETLKMDAWIPDGPGPFPCVILVHGGGWKSGDKQFNFSELWEPLSKAGFAWFTVNYRLAPSHVYPAAIDDVSQAIRFVQTHAAEYRVDAKRIALAGESSGGHIAALVGARYGRELGLAAVVPFYPATDFSKLAEGPEKSDKGLRGGLMFIGATELTPESRERLREASPVFWVRKDMPPFLFVHGTEDMLLSVHQSTQMCDRMKEAGAACEVYTLAGAPHGADFWEGHPEWLGYKQKVIGWLRQTMR